MVYVKWLTREFIYVSLPDIIHLVQRTIWIVSSDKQRRCALFPLWAGCQNSTTPYLLMLALIGCREHRVGFCLKCYSQGNGGRELHSSALVLVFMYVCVLVHRLLSTQFEFHLITVSHSALPLILMILCIILTYSLCLSFSLFAHSVNQRCEKLHIVKIDQSHNTK